MCDRRLCVAVAVTLLVVFVLPGCSSPRVPQDEIDYFQSLSGTRYWTKTDANIVVLNATGGTVTLLGDVASGKEAYLQFKDFAIVKGTSRRPLKASVAVTGSDGTSSLPTTCIDATAANMAVLQSGLAGMEIDEARTRRLEVEKAASAAAALKDRETAQLQQVMKDARSLQKKGQFRSAIARLESMRSSSMWSGEQETLYKQLVGSEVNRIMRLCTFKDDEFKKVQFFTSDRDQGSKPFRFYPYLAKDAASSWWFLRLTLYRSDWLFAKQVQVIVNGTVYPTVVKDSFSSDVRTDVLDGGVFEEVSFRQTDAGSNDLFKAITDYTGTAPLKVRVNGTDYYSEYTLGSADIQAWKDLWFLYQHLDEYTFSAS